MKKIFITTAILLLAFVCTSTTWALDQTQVSQLYVSIFGRASEGEGNSYWQTDPQSTSMTATANVMLNTEPAKTYFGTTLHDNAAFVAHIYTYTLGKEYADDPTGQDYWVSELTAGKSKGEMIAALISAAQHSDNAGPAQIQFNNKVAASNYCAENIAAYTELDIFTNFISSITDSEATLTAAKGLIDTEVPTMSQNSFFPQTSDAMQSISWRYRINNGQPINASFEGISLSMQFSDLTLSINKSDMIRKGSFSGSVSGQASGNFTAEFSENLEPDSSTTLVNSQTIDINLTISADGQTLSADIYATTVFNSPAEWFLDNDNLDEMAYGLYDSQGAISCNLNGYVNLTVPGYGSEYVPISENVTSAETWSIVEKLDTYTVGEKTYSNVVVVDRNTILPPSFSSNYNETLSMRYWVAKGIGMVKGIGQYQMLGQSLTIELVDTNLQ